MAKEAAKDQKTQFNNILNDITKRIFHPLYIISGEETYFRDVIINTLISNVLEEDQRDFNQTIVYGTDQNINGDAILSLSRKYPIFADHVLVIVKEAQELKQTKNLETYIDSPSPQTILVLSYSKPIDKRTTFYKKAKDKSCFFDASSINENSIFGWIKSLVTDKGLVIEEQAVTLMGEYVGPNLKKIVMEVDKIAKVLPDGVKNISISDVEKNTGMSREFNAFELCNAIGTRDVAKAFKIAHHFGENPKKYPIQMTFGALFFYFNKALKAAGYREQDGGTFMDAIKRSGIYYGQQSEYLNVLNNFKLVQLMRIIALIREYDYKSKSNAGGESSEEALLLEFISKSLH